jgi:hypothetical protein
MQNLTWGHDCNKTGSVVPRVLQSSLRLKRRYTAEREGENCMNIEGVLVGDLMWNYIGMRSSALISTCFQLIAVGGCSPLSLRSAVC